MRIDQFVDFVFNKIVAYCCAKFNSFEERELFAAELIEMLLKNYPDKYANEIVGGYYLADKKRLTDEDSNTIELFRMVDYRQCSNIIHAFDRYFKKTFELELKNQKFWYEEQKDTKPSEEEIENSFINSLKQALDCVKSKKEYNVSGTDLFLYQELKNRQIIDISEERNKIEIDLATKKFKSELLQQKTDPNTSFGKRAEFSHLLENILPNDIRIVNIAKRKILNDHLKEWVKNGLNISTLKQKVKSKNET